MKNNTCKQWLIFMLVIVLVVLAAHYLKSLSTVLWTSYQWVHAVLAPLFSGRGVGPIILGVLSLGLVPVVIGAIPAGVYWILTKKQFPYFWPLVWAVLLVLATLLMGHV